MFLLTVSRQVLCCSFSFFVLLCGFICGVCFVLICSSSLLLWCLEMTVLRACGIFLVSSLIFFKAAILVFDYNILFPQNIPSGHTTLKQCCFYVSSTSHYENIPIQIYWKVNRRKIENFQTKNSNIFHISAQNIDCGYSLEPPHRGGSNEYPQSMFLSRNKKKNVYPCKPRFCYIKVGFKGVKII